MQDQLASCTQLLQAATAARPLTSQQQPNLQLTQLQKQLASTSALDCCLRSVGAAYAALMGRNHKEGAASAAQFLVDASGGPGVVTSKVLKLGDCSMKQLRNGDVYKVGWAGCRVGCICQAPQVQPCLGIRSYALQRLKQRSMCVRQAAMPVTLLQYCNSSGRVAHRISCCGAADAGPLPNSRKNGEGSYFFINADVYEGEFKDDRMAGNGVYSFSPEGRCVPTFVMFARVHSCGVCRQSAVMLPAASCQQ